MRPAPGPDQAIRTDADLSAASVGSSELVAAVFDRHARTVHRYLARRAGSAPAEDLLAQTFLVAFEGRGRYDTARPDALPTGPPAGPFSRARCAAPHRGRRPR